MTSIIKQRKCFHHTNMSDEPILHRDHDKHKHNRLLHQKSFKFEVSNRLII